LLQIFSRIRIVIGQYVVLIVIPCAVEVVLGKSKGGGTVPDENGEAVFRLVAGAYGNDVASRRCWRKFLIRLAGYLLIFISFPTFPLVVDILRSGVISGKFCAGRIRFVGTAARNNFAIRCYGSYGYGIQCGGIPPDVNGVAVSVLRAIAYVNEVLSRLGWCEFPFKRRIGFNTLRLVIGPNFPLDINRVGFAVVFKGKLCAERVRVSFGTVTRGAGGDSYDWFYQIDIIRLGGATGQPECEEYGCRDPQQFDCSFHHKTLLCNFVIKIYIRKYISVSGKNQSFPVICRYIFRCFADP
jgi:hypothetical protein